MKAGLVVLITLALLAGCSDKDCSNQMADIKASHGTAEEVNTYDSDDYHNVDWWYWSKGFQYSFTWGENVDGCDVSRYTFDPITRSSLNASSKSAAQESKILIEQYFCPGTAIPTR